MARGLTKKEKGFVKDFVKTGNGVKAALKNYNTTDYSTAGNIASENLNKPKIINAVKSLADRIPDELVIERHIDLLNARTILGQLDPTAVKAGVDMAYKLKGSYAPDKIKHSGIVAFGELENLTNEELAKLAEPSE